MSKVKSTKAKSTKAKSVKPKAPKVESKKVENAKPKVESLALSPRDLRAALKGKPAAERNQLRRANALAVKNARKAKALQA